MLLNLLVKDEKKIDKELYSSGPYWNYKNKRAIIEIKKKGLKDFRGITAGIGTSFADNLVLDIRNEFNIKGRIVGKIFSLPLLNIIFNGQINTTKNYLDSFIKNQAIVFKNSQNVQNLISKFKFHNTTDFGCIQSFEYLNKNYSCHYLNMAYRINNLSKNFDFKNMDDEVVKYEPKLALDGGIDGLSEIRKIVLKSSELIKKNGKLILEIAFDQKEEVKKIFSPKFQ